MKKLLIVSYWYPPLPAMGSVRIASFVRHLPKFGWQAHILTIKMYQAGVPVPVDEDPALVCRTDSFDFSLAISRVFRNIRGGTITRAEAGKAEGISLKRAALGFYDRFVAFPDAVWPWRHLGWSDSLAFARKVQPDAILSSSPPATAHRVAAQLGKVLAIPWVADYRDPWSQTAWLDLSSVVRDKARKLELETMRNAAALCTTSQPLAQELVALHGKPTFVVTNGFEPDEIPREIIRSDRFTLLYTGMMYPGKRDPRLLFEALASFAAKTKISPSDLRVAFYGPHQDVTMDLALRAGVSSFVECHARVPRTEALALQRSADVLLQLEWNSDVTKGVYPGKFFEYLGAGRPILAIGPKGGVIDETLKRTGCGELVSTVEEIEVYLGRALKAYRAGVSMPYQRDEAELRLHTRERQAGILAARLSALVGEKIS